MLCLQARAKINWTLDILGTRQDGYHLMDMLMQTVELADTLWLEEAPFLTLEAAPGGFATIGEQDAYSAAEVIYDHSNLVYRAAAALAKDVHCTKGARLRLLKRIPSGAGMGGGSADAAAALLGLNRLWRLNLPLERLCRIGVKLGADIPFMLHGGLARVGGIGEQITPLSPAPAVWLVLVQPCGGLSTKEIFTAYDSPERAPLVRPQNAEAQAALLKGDLSALGAAMGNVLEAVSLPKRPAIGEAAQQLEALGAVRGMMTGSGSVVYGVFVQEEAARKAQAALQELYAFCQLTRTAGDGVVWE